MSSNPDYKVKQVIVVRKDLRMRMGKVAAQAAHASIAWLTNYLRKDHTMKWDDLTDAEQEWIAGPFTKICVYVNSEEELVDVYQRALEAELETFLITDAGFTEFGGVPTKTCCSIGPDYNDRIDEITGSLPLL